MDTFSLDNLRKQLLLEGIGPALALGLFQQSVVSLGKPQNWPD